MLAALRDDAAWCRIEIGRADHADIEARSLARLGSVVLAQLPIRDREQPAAKTTRGTEAIDALDAAEECLLAKSGASGPTLLRKKRWTAS